MEGDTNYEQQGAKPKTQTTTKPEPEDETLYSHDESCQFDCVYISNNSNGAVRIQKSEVIFKYTTLPCITVPASDLRWVGHVQYQGLPESVKRCICVSYVNRVEDQVCYIFLSVVNEYVEQLLNKLREVIHRKFASVDERWRSTVFTLLQDQPMYEGTCRLSLEDALSTLIECKDTLMIIDMECVTWFSERYEKMLHQLYFWEDDHEKSVEMIKRNRDNNTLKLESRLYSFIVPAPYEVVRNLMNLKPKKKNVMSDPRLFLSAVEDYEMPRVTLPVRSIGAPGQNTSPFVWPQQGIQPQPAGSSGLDYPSWNVGNEEWVSDHAKHIEDEMDEAERQFRGDEYFSNMWITLQFDLEELEKDGEVPETDYLSGGLDPDNVQHLRKALSDIEDHLKENELPISLSRMRACRALFSTSKASHIGQIFKNNSDTNMLRKLYFKTLTR